MVCFPLCRLETRETLPLFSFIIYLVIGQNTTKNPKKSVYRTSLIFFFTFPLRRCLALVFFHPIEVLPNPLFFFFIPTLVDLLFYPCQMGLSTYPLPLRPNFHRWSLAFCPPPFTGFLFLLSTLLFSPLMDIRFSYPFPSIRPFMEYRDGFWCYPLLLPSPF